MEYNVEKIKSLASEGTGKAFFDHLKSRVRKKRDINIRLIAKRINRPFDELVDVLRQLDADKLGRIEMYRNKPDRFHFNLNLPALAKLSDGIMPSDKSLNKAPIGAQVMGAVRRTIRRPKKVPLEGFGGASVKVTGGHIAITKGNVRIDADMPASTKEIESLAALLKAV